MNISAISIVPVDNGGRRSGFERRHFSYTNHIPERRNDPDRRVLTDRRRLIDRRWYADHEAVKGRPEFLKNMLGFECRRKRRERRSRYNLKAGLQPFQFQPEKTHS